ncbi:hypothetical protein GHT09_006567 [Marmota monax]|uniref:Protein Wnt n=1 Tax=Marmota monax TaxID=9995 RepID=A0A834QQH3_MARMO|nr:hypothetical protein GHT09_006567 [Marmota monax]
MDRATLLALPRLCALWAVLFALFPCGVQGNWMWLGIASFGVPEKLGCANLPLNSRQKELCKRKPYLLPSIREGARLGIQECRSQFKHERWNCMVATANAAAAAPLGTSPLFGYELTSAPPYLSDQLEKHDVGSGECCSRICFDLTGSAAHRALDKWLTQAKPHVCRLLRALGGPQEEDFKGPVPDHPKRG